MERFNSTVTSTTCHNGIETAGLEIFEHLSYQLRRKILMNPSWTWMMLWVRDLFGVSERDALPVVTNFFRSTRRKSGIKIFRPWDSQTVPNLAELTAVTTVTPFYYCCWTSSSTVSNIEKETSSVSSASLRAGPLLDWTVACWARRQRSPRWDWLAMKAESHRGTRAEELSSASLVCRPSDASVAPSSAT